MTFEQLRIFEAVAEREHLTRAAEALHLTPSAVSAAIRSLEASYDVELFHRIGRRIELTEAGRLFLKEARAVLARAEAARLRLAELGGLEIGTLAVAASQTVASYWLPPLLMRFHDQYPGISLNLTIGNTRQVADAVQEGTVEIGFVEGHVNRDPLQLEKVAEDALLVVVGPGHPWGENKPHPPLTAKDLEQDAIWILREEGSGTRAVFEEALKAHGGDPVELRIGLVLPSNEAVLSAVRSGPYATAISEIAAAPFLQGRGLERANVAFPGRAYSLLTHRERHMSRSAQALATLARKEHDKSA